MYKVRITTQQGGFYYPRLEFDTAESAEEWAKSQVMNSNRLESFEVVNCEPELYEEEANEQGYWAFLVVTIALLCVALLFNGCGL